MATFSFTFDLRHGDALLAQIDGRAITDDDDVIEVLLTDLATGDLVPVSGELERQVVLFLKAHSFYRAKLTEAVEDECAGRVAYDRETADSLKTMAPLMVRLSSLAAE